MSKASFKEQVFKVREDAIVAAMNRLLASKGYDLMTMDEVAAEVGISKASLYKHFASKEELAAAAIVLVLEEALRLVAQLDLDTSITPAHKLRTVVRWALGLQLAGQMPSLPSQNSALRQALVAHSDYMDRLLEVSDKLGAWITLAQESGDISSSLPGQVVLFTLFARACDPVLGLLKQTGQYDDETIVKLIMTTCFDGLGPAAGHETLRPPVDGGVGRSPVGAGARFAR